MWGLMSGLTRPSRKDAVCYILERVLFCACICRTYNPYCTYITQHRSIGAYLACTIFLNKLTSNTAERFVLEWMLLSEDKATSWP